MTMLSTPFERSINISTNSNVAKPVIPPTEHKMKKFNNDLEKKRKSVKKKLDTLLIYTLLLGSQNKKFFFEKGKLKKSLILNSDSN